MLQLAFFAQDRPLDSLSSLAHAPRTAVLALTCVIEVNRTIQMIVSGVT
jgi:hypothetical protein